MGLFGKKRQNAFGNKSKNNNGSDIVKDVENILEEEVEEPSMAPAPVNSFYATDGDDLPGNDTQGTELSNLNENIEKENLEVPVPTVQEDKENEDEFILEEVKEEIDSTPPIVEENNINNDMNDNSYLNNNTMEEDNMYAGNNDYNPGLNVPEMGGGLNNYGQDIQMQNDPYMMQNNPYGDTNPAAPVQETPDYGMDMSNQNMYDGQNYGMDNNMTVPVQDMQVPVMDYGQMQGNDLQVNEYNPENVQAPVFTTPENMQVPTMEVPVMDTLAQGINAANPIDPFGNIEQNMENVQEYNPDMGDSPKSIDTNDFATPNPFGTNDDNSGFNAIPEPQQPVQASEPIMEVLEGANPSVPPETDDGEVTINNISECRDDNIWGIFDNVYKNHSNEIKSFICANAVCTDKTGNISNKIVYSYIFDKDISNLESIKNILIETEGYLPKGTAIYLDSEIVNNDIIPMLQSA